MSSPLRTVPQAEPADRPAANNHAAFRMPFAANRCSRVLSNASNILDGSTRACQDGPHKCWGFSGPLVEFFAGARLFFTARERSRQMDWHGGNLAGPRTRFLTAANKIGWRKPVCWMEQPRRD